MLTNIIHSLALSPTQKMIFLKLATLYEENLPHSLYLDPYKLEEELGGESEDWKQFLKIPEINRFIEGEIAMIAEIGARAALQKLQTGNHTSQDIQAAKELINNSKLLKQKTNQFQQFIITRIPEKERKVQNET